MEDAFGSIVMLGCAGFTIIFTVIQILLCALVPISIAFWVWMLIDSIQRQNYEKPDDRTTWILINCLGGAIGSLVYYFVIKKKLPPV